MLSVKTVFGTVLNTLEKGVEGVKVSTGDAVGYSDKDGKWSLEIDSAQRKCEFEFWHRDYFPSRITGTIDGAFRAFDFGSVELRPLPIGGNAGGSILVEDVVVDQFGRPIRGIQVDCMPIDKNEIVAQLLTNNKGGFSMLLNPGRYQILLWKYGFNNNTPRQYILEVDENKGQIN